MRLWTTTLQRQHSEVCAHCRMLLRGTYANKITLQELHSVCVLSAWQLPALCTLLEKSRAPQLASLEVSCFDGVLPDLSLLPGSLTFLHLRDIRTTKGALSFTEDKLGEPKCHGTMQVDVETHRCETLSACLVCSGGGTVPTTYCC